jgi:acyl-CoA synthetase (AMP-forming)/AMP-acid ligase II
MNPSFRSSVVSATWIDVLQERVSAHPDRRAYAFLIDGEAEGAVLTYRELERRVRAMAGWLQAQGARDARALLVYPPGLEYIVAFLACLYAGVVAVPTYPPRLNRPDHRLQAIVEDAQATLALTTAAILDTLDERVAHAPELRGLRWLATDAVDPALSGRWRRPDASAGTLAFLQYTSGSTGRPRGVMVTHGQALSNALMVDAAVEATPDAHGVFWLPPYHDMGLVGGILQTVFSGVSTTMMSPFAFLQRPLRWLQAVARTRATHSGGPNFAYELCVSRTTPAQRAALDLRAWRVAFCGAEPIRGETLDRFAEAFAPAGFRPEAYRSAYGLAEATLLVSAGTPGAGARRYTLDAAALEQHRVVQVPEGSGGRTTVSCGRPVAGVEVAVVDPVSEEPCAADHVGEVWVRGPNVASGYWNRLNESAAVFGAHLPDGRGPFLRTGDLGFLQDGELVITGRIKDLIILDGRNHYPQDIEEAVERSVPGLRPGGCAAFSVDTPGGERLVVAAEVERGHLVADHGALGRAIRRAVAEEHAVHVYRVALLRPWAIPRTSSGKIQRHACRAAFLAGTLDPLDAGS